MARKISITEADRAVLGPLAKHRILIAPQVAHLLEISEGAAARRLQRLDQAGLIHYRRVFHRAPAAARISSRGLGAIEHAGRAPSENLQEYRHDVGVGWLWLAARGGAFGSVTHIATDREMRAADGAAAADRCEALYGVGLGMLGSGGRPQRHYPDIMLDASGGHRIAVELELTQKSSVRMARIMSAFASDTRIDAVLYVVANKPIADLVIGSATRAGIADLVHVQRLGPEAIAGAGTRAADRVPTKASVQQHRSRALGAGR